MGYRQGVPQAFPFTEPVGASLCQRSDSLCELRHSFQDRIVSQNLTEQVSAELMGHEIRR